MNDSLSPMPVPVKVPALDTLDFLVAFHGRGVSIPTHVGPMSYGEVLKGEYDRAAAITRGGPCR